MVRRILILMIMMTIMFQVSAYQDGDKIDYVLNHEKIEKIYSVGGCWAYIEDDSLLIELGMVNFEKYFKQSDGSIFDIKRNDFRLSGKMIYGRAFIQDEHKEIKVDTLLYVVPDKFETIPEAIKTIEEESFIISDSKKRFNAQVMYVDRCMPYEKGFLIISDYNGLGVYCEDFRSVYQNWISYLSICGNKVLIDLTDAEEIGYIGNIHAIKLDYYSKVVFLDQAGLFWKY